jgi:hypothetical protein
VSKTEAPVEATEPLNANALPPLIALKRTPRDHVARWIEMRSQGMRNIEIAPILGITPHTLNCIIVKATKEGWLKFESPADRLEQELSHLVVDNVEHHLKKRDRRMTIEAAKGLGLFKSHHAVKVENDAPKAVLALKIEPLDGPADVIEGNIIGKPKELPRSFTDENGTEPPNGTDDN